jgi:CheY-like chemotaxis protein
VKTLLVVDDEEGILEALSDALSDEGYRVLIARNGKDGLKRVSETLPDLILLDYMMPVMDGRELLKVLRAEPTYRHIPVVMMSAMPRSSLPADCEPTAFLRKPFNLDTLLAELERLLGRTVN